MQAGITFHVGGLAVDPSMRVLDRSRSTSLLAGNLTSADDEAATYIPGLFAAGCDLGGVSCGAHGRSGHRPDHRPHR